MIPVCQSACQAAARLVRAGGREGADILGSRTSDAVTQKQIEAVAATALAASPGIESRLPPAQQPGGRLRRLKAHKSQHTATLRMSDRTSIDKRDSAKIATLKHTLNKTYMTNNIQRHNLQS